ncbi:MAG: SMC-Scp complex subunit ScpB [Patescibacteria group bacterium]|nr:SMC-Scp complex subunit ScpB [Patescibacteria group bacterium]
MDRNNLTGAIEALLFVYGEALGIKKIAEILETDEEKITEAANLLKEKLEAEGGLALLIAGKNLQIVTKPELSEDVKKLVKEEMDSELSPASLETLAIIAYLGPVSRAEIDYIRGVNSSFILRSLSIRGLVDKRNNPNHGGTFVYETSIELLKHIGLDTSDKLPEYEKYRDLLKSLREGDKNKRDAQAKAASAPESSGASVEN